jgi:putative membrane protein
VKKPGKFEIIITLFGLGGAALLAWIIWHSNPAAIFAMLIAARWRLCVVVAYHLVPLSLDAIAWQFLFPAPTRPRLLQLFRMRWIGESVSNMLPALQVGGDVVRARLVATRGAAPAPAAAASVLVDITLSIFTQSLFTIAGLSVLAVVSRQLSAGPIVAGALLMLLVLAGFYSFQRLGMFRIIASLVSRLAGAGEWQALVQGGQALDDATRDLYQHPRSLVLSATATMSSWIFGAGEALLSLWALNLPVKVSIAFIYESVGQGIEAAMFFVPGALGLQEGAYIGVGKLLGLSVQAALALALIRRTRELSFGIPGVITWQIIEARRAWLRRHPQVADAH